LIPTWDGPWEGGDEILIDRVAYLEGEVERLASELKRLDDEGQFLNRLLLKGGGRAAPAAEG
jgi:hypothetical protein